MIGSQLPFLIAEWRHLAMLNFEVDPAVVHPLVPASTELDDFRGRTFVSLVGFLFLDTRVFGVRIPRHADFEEVNLRFYVRRKTSEGDAARLYGERFAASLTASPASAFLVAGSKVKVFTPTRLSI